MESTSLRGDYSAESLSAWTSAKCFAFSKRRDFFIRHAIVVPRRNGRRGFLHLGNCCLFTVCRDTLTKKHRDSMLRREIRRQIDRRVVKPHRLGEDAVFLISSSGRLRPAVPKFVYYFCQSRCCCQSRILFRREIHLMRKSVLIYLVARKWITFVTATIFFFLFF